MSSEHALTVCILSFLITFSSAFPEQGKWEFKFITAEDLVDAGIPVSLPKSLFEGSEIYISVTADCFPYDPSAIAIETTDALKISWTLEQPTCWNEYSQRFEYPALRNRSIGPFIRTSPCMQAIELDDQSRKHYSPMSSSVNQNSELGKTESDSKKTEGTQRKRDESKSKQSETAVDHGTEKTVAVPIKQKALHSKGNRIYTIEVDGIYELQLYLDMAPSSVGNLTIGVEMIGPHGYLSAVDWPLLPFYGAMCLTYVILGLTWLVVSFCQWRNLLRIHFWIGGVILLGVLEKAAFYAEYESINSTGQSLIRGALLLAELVSCGKRMLARMLVIIVSLGFGIVKPRLGSMLYRVVFIGILYFVVAAAESYLRVMHASNQILLASILLAVLDSAICWWIFTSLVKTTRTLRVHRNLVKLSLYRHFTYTLIFSVVSSVVFMLYSICYHHFNPCFMFQDWKELWVDDAYWHLLFSILLLVIMILWRPTNNKQSFKSLNYCQAQVITHKPLNSIKFTEIS